MRDAPYPILEFDEDREAVLTPRDLIKPGETAVRCVLCFFREAVEKAAADFPHRIAGYLQSETLRLPIYELEYRGERITLVQASVGAPAAAAQLEELIAFGCRRFVACGSCGVLRRDIAAGHLIVPVAAVREEGTSYHYLPPAREIEADARAVSAIEETLRAGNAPYIKGKTWTTDAIYRETESKIRRRRQEGCVTVEMEAAAYMAVARFRDVCFGQILYAGDNLDGKAWDGRGFQTLTDVRARVLRVSLDACLALEHDAALPAAESRREE